MDRDALPDLWPAAPVRKLLPWWRRSPPVVPVSRPDQVGAPARPRPQLDGSYKERMAAEGGPCTAPRLTLQEASRIMREASRVADKS